MANSIKVTDRSSVYVGRTEELLAQLLPQKRVIVISDTNIDRTHHDLIAPYEHILIGLGEQAKSLITLDEIYRRLIELGADRSTFILGIGGGIVTDIAGFVLLFYLLRLANLRKRIAGTAPYRKNSPLRSSLPTHLNTKCAT